MFCIIKLIGIEREAICLLINGGYERSDHDNDNDGENDNDNNTLHLRAYFCGRHSLKGFTPSLFSSQPAPWVPLTTEEEARFKRYYMIMYLIVEYA